MTEAYRVGNFKMRADDPCSEKDHRGFSGAASLSLFPFDDKVSAQLIFC